MNRGKENPVISAINSFDYPEKIHGIVDDNYDTWSWLIPTTAVYFFGYEEQCIKKLKEFPNSKLVNKLKERLIEKQ